MSRRTLFFFAVFSTALSFAVADSRFTMSVDSIMRGPGLVGYEPRSVRWSGNNEHVYFEWKLAPDPVLKDFDTWIANRDGTGLRKLTDEQAKFAPPVTGDTSKDKRRTVYAHDGDIYVYDHATDKARRLLQTNDAEASPRFLRDGKRVSFVRGNNLFVFPVDGGEVVQVTDIRIEPDPEKKPTPSQESLKAQERDLLQIIRERAVHREEEEARKKKENPRKPLHLSPRQRITNLFLSPDETQVIASITERPNDPKTAEIKTAIVPNYITESAYTESITARTKVGDVVGVRQRVALISTTTGEVTYVDTGLKQAAPAQRTENPPPPADRELTIVAPVFSEDGTRAVMQASAVDNKDRWLLALDTKTGKTRVLVTMHDDAWVGLPGPSRIGWMKNDREIYFVWERDGYAHLYTVPFEGGEPRQLTSGKWEIWNLELSQEKDRFYLTTNEEHPGERHLYVMDANGGPRRKLTGAAGIHKATVSPDEKSIADVYSYVNRPPELFVQAGSAEAKPAKITDSPLPEFWAYPWKDAPIVSVPARDGVNVPGRLYKPAKPVRGGPAVIFVHGAGYLQNVHKGWSNYYREYMFHHLLTERGYTVLDINYRGSAGYGRDWRTAIYRHMGGKDLEDHIDAAKWLVSQHNIDPKRIGIYGGSYGGFITLMAMFRHPDTFAAGAALRPVTDWAHYNHGYTSNILNVPYSDKEAYRQSSPIYFAEGLKGALLICHGLVDVNVHAQDSIRLAQKLIELRKENWELALYPVEDHAFVQPTSWADEYKRILKLFERYLRVEVGK